MSRSEVAFESNEVVSSTIEEKGEKKMKQRMAKPLKQFQTRVRKIIIGSGCGSVGRVVTSNTRGPWFKSSYQQNLY